MPINKITAPSEVPASVDDYSAQNNLTEALLLAAQGAQRIVAANVAKGAVFLVGGATYLADADTAISGSASDYVKLTPSVDGLTLAPSYVADLTGVAWSSAYNGYYDASGNLYVFDELKALSLGTITTAKLRDIGLKNLGAGWATALIGSFMSNFNYVSGNNPLYEHAAYIGHSNNTYTKMTDRHFMQRSGQVTIDFTIKTSNAANEVSGVIYKNGVIFGGESSTTSTTGETFSFTVNVVAGDYIEIYTKSTSTNTVTLTYHHTRVGNVI